jgi:hypothetical protein
MLITTNFVNSNTLRRDVEDTTLCYKVCQRLTVAKLFSSDTPASSTKQMLKVALNTTYLNQTNEEREAFVLTLSV